MKTDNSIANNEIKYFKKQKRLLIWALVAVALFVAALSANYFRKPQPASYNFGFNMMFFLPTVITATIISYFVAGETILNWRRLPNIKSKIISLLLTLPILVLFILGSLRFFRQH